MRLLVLVVVLLTGCADPARNLYEGIKQSNDAKRTPVERATQPTPDYDTYQETLNNEVPQ